MGWWKRNPPVAAATAAAAAAAEALSCPRWAGELGLRPGPPRKESMPSSVGMGDGGLSSSDWDRRLIWHALSSTNLLRNALSPWMGVKSSTAFVLSNLLYAPSRTVTNPSGRHWMSRT